LDCIILPLSKIHKQLHVTVRKYSGMIKIGSILMGMTERHGYLSHT
jgi:hypothetical protein